MFTSSQQAALRGGVFDIPMLIFLLKLSFINLLEVKHVILQS